MSEIVIRYLFSDCFCSFMHAEFKLNMFRYEKLFILLHALPSALAFVHTHFTGKKNFRDPIMDNPGEILISPAGI